MDVTVQIIIAVIMIVLPIMAALLKMNNTLVALTMEVKSVVKNLDVNNRRIDKVEERLHNLEIESGKGHS